jgi:hypothetical protein
MKGIFQWCARTESTQRNVQSERLLSNTSTVGNGYDPIQAMHSSSGRYVAGTAFDHGNIIG